MDRILAAAARISRLDGIGEEDYRVRLDQVRREGNRRKRTVAERESRLARHQELEEELKGLRKNIKAVEKHKEDLVAQARACISREDAQALILERLHSLLHKQYDGYLRQYRRNVIAAVENLWDKYAVTAQDILRERDQAAAEFDQFLGELGYA